MNKIIYKNLKLHTVPLEKILINSHMIKITVDDITEKTYELIFDPYQAIKIITIDCVDIDSYYCDECYYEGCYHNHLIEVEGSLWIKNLKDELKKNDEEAYFLDKSRHFVVATNDNIIEIIAEDLQLNQMDKK